MSANIPRDTKSFLTLLTRGVKPCRLLEKIFPEEFPRNHKSAEQENKISYDDEWTSSQTFNYFLCIFSSKNYFLFN